jgi:hypothetical protein
MERRINKKFDEYITAFKDGIKNNVNQLGNNSDPIVVSVIKFVNDYDRLVLTKNDFMKRKRVKNSVHLADRCCAKRASTEQCTRRKKNGFEYCGTHIKGTPHGTCESEDNEKPCGQKIEVWVQEIQGIVYYIDANHNIYQTEDIYTNKINPKIIAKYFKDGDTYYHL